MLELFKDIKDDLQAVEKELKAVVLTPNPTLTETSTNQLNAGGKRLRPALSLLGAKFCDFNLEKVLPLAVALELIHTATLVHDDVVDASMTRRGMPTIKAMFGNSVSTYIGTFLFARSLILISNYEEKPLISRVLSDASVKMCEGEIYQISTSFDINQNLKDYFYRIKHKTALLFAASVQLGAVACGAPENIYLPLRRYGLNAGMAFQITDDILDLVADQRQLGKPIGCDLRSGIITLPVIYALDRSGRDSRLAGLVGKVDKSEAEVQEAIDAIKECGAIEYSIEVAGKYIKKAKSELESLPAIPVRDTLAMAADFIGSRKF